MESENREEILQNETPIDMGELIKLVIRELRKNTKVSEKVAEQIIRDALNEKLLLEL